MRIVFLHLSDFHLQNSDGIHPAKINSVVDLLKIYMPFNGIVIVLSGDIAASGEENQYKLASKFLGRLIVGIQQSYSIIKKNIKVLTVPGNHDINWGGDKRPTPETIRAFTDENRDKNLQLDLQRMRNYFNFSACNDCFFTDKCRVPFGQLIVRKILHFDSEYRIEVNLINTAPFSCGEDDGLHYLPEDAIQILKKESQANISIAVMHHSPDWFGFSQKQELATIIAQRCSLAFFGHEHIAGTQHIFYDNGSHIIKQAGGVWWQRSTPMFSEYYAALFDSDSLNYSLNKFSWDQTNCRFISESNRQYTLMTKSLGNYGLTYQENYLTALAADNKCAISQDISDYFIFPTLHLDVSKEYSRGRTVDKMKDFVASIKENKYVAILGGSNSGKTTLLKMLFKELQSQFVVLYCGTDDITGRSQENILKELVQNAFGTNSYTPFQKIPRENKAIIIDDLHRISSKHLNKFMRGIENIFGTIIIGTEETSQFDVVQMAKDNIKSDTDFRKFSISRLYAEKRLSLIKKIVLLKTENDEARAVGITRTLEQCLNSYKLAFRAEIHFVVQFVDYYCGHMGELDKSDATVFSKVFEASIEKAITPHLIGRKENSNDIIVALSEVAYYIHFKKEYPISGENINGVITEYCQYYDNRHLTSARFLQIVEASGLLIRTSSGYQYRFVSKNHLAYFVAKAVNRRFHDTNDVTDLETIVRESCFSINGDILLFLTYISDNVNIPRLLLEQAVSYVSEWTEFDALKTGIKYLQSMPTNNLSAPDAQQREQEIHKQAIAEEQNDVAIETLDIYDYDETEIDNLNNQLLRALLQLKIIARNFSAFISILPAKVKREYVLAMYQLPNKIFNQWAESVDNSIDQLVDEVIMWQNQPEFKGKKWPREDIVRFFQETSLNMLLNLYFGVASYGVNDNTVDYLAQQDYISASLNYRIERLMFYEKVDDYQAVIKDAERILSEYTDGLVKNLILSILYHMLVYSDKITDRDRRRISAVHFPPRVQTNILVNRQKALKEKGI